MWAHLNQWDFYIAKKYLEVDFYSLLSCVLIIWQSTHNLASTRNIK